MTKKTTEKDEENECVTIDVSEPKEKKDKKEKKNKKHVIAFEESVEKEDDSDEIDEDDSDDEDDDDEDDSDDEITGLTDMGLYNVLGNFLVDEDGNTIGMSLSNIAKELSKINHSIKNHGVEKKDKKKSA